MDVGQHEERLFQIDGEIADLSFKATQAQLQYELANSRLADINKRILALEKPLI